MVSYVIGIRFMTSRSPVLNWTSGELECAILFFKTCSATSSISLVSWFYVLILNISVDLVSFAVHAQMTHLFVCNLKESHSTMLNNLSYVPQSPFHTFIIFHTSHVPWFYVFDCCISSISLSCCPALWVVVLMTQMTIRVARV